MANFDSEFVTLTEGIVKEPSCNVYAVVNCVVQEPKITGRNTYHGICILVDPSCYEGSVKCGEFCIQIFTSSKSSAYKIEYGDVVILRRITKQKCLKNPEKREFLLRSDTDNTMVVFPNGQRGEVRMGGGMGPVPQDITMDNLCCVESLSNWHRHIVSGIPTSIKSTAKSSPINWPKKLKEQLSELDMYSSRLRLEQQSLASLFLAEAAAQIKQLINTDTISKRYQIEQENEFECLSKKFKKDQNSWASQH